MGYQPRGKVGGLLEAMRADSGRIWTSADVAVQMEVPQAQVSAHVEAAIRHGRLFRRLDGSGRCQYSTKPFANDDLRVPTFGKSAAAAAADAVGAESKHARSLGAAGFVPAQMTAPRPGSDDRLPTRAPGTPPAPAHVDAPVPPPAPTPAPSPAPTPAPPAEAVGANEPAPPEEADEEVVAPNAFVDVGSGDVILIGCEVDEDGRVTVPSDLVRKIVGRMAWSPLR